MGSPLVVAIQGSHFPRRHPVPLVIRRAVLPIPSSRRTSTRSMRASTPSRRASNLSRRSSSPRTSCRIVRALPEGSWVYAHLLIDQTNAEPEQLHGELRGRTAQLAMMAAYRASWPLLQQLIPLLAELGQAGRTEDLRQLVVYIATTTREPERWRRFREAVRRQVPEVEN